MFSYLCENSADDKLEHFLKRFFPEKGFDISCKLSTKEEMICMKSQNLFSGKNKLPSHESVLIPVMALAVRDVKFKAGLSVLGTVPSVPFKK